MASEDLRSAVEDKALRLRELFEVVGFPVSFMFLGGRSSGRPLEALHQDAVGRRSRDHACLSCTAKVAGCGRAGRFSD